LWMVSPKPPEPAAAGPHGGNGLQSGSQLPTCHRSGHYYPLI
jgi:hypothetical protein